MSIYCDKPDTLLLSIVGAGSCRFNHHITALEMTIAVNSGLNPSIEQSSLPVSKGIQ